MHFVWLVSLAALGAVTRALTTGEERSEPATFFSSRSSCIPKTATTTGTSTGHFSGNVHQGNTLLHPWPSFRTHKSNSVLYNASVAVCDPNSDTFERSIDFPPLTLDPVYHASGIEVDIVTRKLSVLVNSGIAFDSEGANVTGDNFLFKVDLASPGREVLWCANLTAATEGEVGAGARTPRTTPLAVRLSCARTQPPCSGSAPTATAWTPGT